jgi:hypothetical protein
MLKIKQQLDAFNGKDFALWKWRIQLILQQKVPELWFCVSPGVKFEEIIQGTWNKRCAKALTIMFLALTPAIRCKCMGIATPNLLLIKLNALYALKDVAKHPSTKK